jgi:hypothetical protein
MNDQQEKCGSGSGEEGTDEDGRNEETDEEDPSFPTLAKALETRTTPIPASGQAAEEDPSNPSTGKYARRRMGESRLAMIERLEAAKDPHLIAEEESEPEVDISNLLARVAALGDSEVTQAGMAEKVAKRRGKHETAVDVENDIDHNLSYLHEKERQRQRAKGRGGSTSASEARTRTIQELSSIDAEGNEIDYEQMKKEKEKAEAVRALKARFQGRGLGERERKDIKSRTAPSLNIGPKPSLSAAHVAAGQSSGSGDSTPKIGGRGIPKPNLAAEVTASLTKTSSSSASSETASSSSGRSSFRTDFGRRRIPLGGHLDGSNASQPVSPPQGDRIDNFLATINNRDPNIREDPSVFTLSDAGTARNSATSDRSRTDRGRGTTAERSVSPRVFSDLSRLESFLDDMLA